MEEDELEALPVVIDGVEMRPQRTDERHRRQGNGLVSAFLQWHIERGLRSLRLVERA